MNQKSQKVWELQIVGAAVLQVSVVEKICDHLSWTYADQIETLQRGIVEQRTQGGATKDSDTIATSVLFDGIRTLNVSHLGVPLNVSGATVWCDKTRAYSCGTPDRDLYFSASHDS